MKHRLIFPIILIMSAFTIMADTITYAYDSAGNRIKREITIQTTSLTDEKVNENYRKNNVFFSEMLSEKEIKIYPNPTYGDFSVEITGFMDTDKCLLGIYNMSGQLIKQTYTDSPVTNFDISSQPNGMYILHISLNGNESSWKIIKK